MNEALNHLFNAIGLLGMVCVLLAYFMQQMGWKHDDLKYILTNIIGAIGLIASLVWNWNMPSFVLESIWLAISCFGLWKWYRKRREQVDTP